MRRVTVERLALNRPTLPLRLGTPQKKGQEEGKSWRREECLGKLSSRHDAAIATQELTAAVVTHTRRGPSIVCHGQGQGS